MNTWTKSQLEEEWRVIYETRLGVLCGMATPTPEQQEMARQEADKHIQELQRE